MKLYHPTKGLRGIRGALRQFDESKLLVWQRNVLRERLLLLSWYDRNGRNKSATALEFETSRSYVRKLVRIREKEGLGGLIPKRTGPKRGRGFELTSEEKQEIERYADMFEDWGHRKLRAMFFLSTGRRLFIGI